MTMHTRTDTFFERCVTAFLYPYDGKARGFARSKAQGRGLGRIICL